MYGATGVASPGVERVVADRGAGSDQRRHDDHDGEGGEQARPQTAPAGGNGRRQGRGDRARRAALVGAGVAGGGVRRGFPVGGRVRFGHTRKVRNDVATDLGRDGRAEIRRRRVTMAGHRGDVAEARRGLADPHPTVQAAALGALARLDELRAADVEATLTSGAVTARRRAVEVALRAHGRGARSSLPRALAGALGDPDPLVVVGAAWFLAERNARAAVPELAATATGHEDARCREAAVAALGAIGDPAGLPAVLSALTDVANGTATGHGRSGRLR